MRGIISGCGSSTERLSGFVDYFLQPGMKSLPSFLQDTKHTLQVIESINDQIESGQFSLKDVNLVSLGIISMYSNMSDELGMSACKEYLDSRNFTENCDEINIASKKISEALQLCIQNNFFQFNDRMFKIKGGVGTGIKLAPPYACIGMGKYEKSVFESQNCLVNLILIWKRFIDDIFMLFKGSISQCEALVNWLNSLMHSLMQGVINFTFEFSKERINFLDI